MVRVSDEPIASASADNIDIGFFMSQPSADKFLSRMNQDGLAIINQQPEETDRDILDSICKIIAFPFSRKRRD